MNNIEVYDPCPSRVGNSQQSARQISFGNFKGISTLGKSVIAVIDSAGRLCIATKLTITLLAVSTLSLLVTSCNFPAEYASLPNPTDQQMVESTEAPTFTPTPEYTPTPEPTPTLEPTATATLTEKEAEQAAKDKLIKDIFEHGVEAIKGKPLNSIEETKDFLGEDEMWKSLGTIKNNIDSLINNQIYSIEIPAFAEPLLASYQNRPNIDIKLRQGEGEDIKPTPEGFWSLETRGFPEDGSLGMFIKDDNGLWQVVLPRNRLALSEWTMNPQGSIDYSALPLQDAYGTLVWVKSDKDAPWTAVQVDASEQAAAILNGEVNIIHIQGLWILAEGVERVTSPELEGPNYFEQKKEKGTGLFAEMRSPRTDFTYEIYLDDIWGKWALERKDDVKTTDFIVTMIYERMRTTWEFKGSWEEFTEYLEEGGKLVLSDISLNNLRTGVVDYFDKIEINKGITLYTDGSSENKPNFKPRYVTNLSGMSSFDMAYDPELPGTIYFYMSMIDYDRYLRSPYSSYNITGQLFIQPGMMLFFTDSQWEKYGRGAGTGRQIGEKGVPLIYSIVDRLSEMVSDYRRNFSNFRIYRVY